MMDKTLLDILCCPVTRLPLEILDDARLQALNAAIRGGKLQNNGDEAIAEEWSEALVSRDGRLVYPVQDGIPILLEEESISWNRVAD